MRCDTQNSKLKTQNYFQSMVNLIIPDKWQQDAMNLLREGKDVVVQAPTGAGKTYIFELLYESLRGPAVYTVPTRTLANDKLAEWRARMDSAFRPGISRLASAHRPKSRACRAPGAPGTSRGGDAQ